ncbi:ABC transporter ATP-binding protein [Exiguobacterium oxidotolerans]|uniref:ABC transporter ATP-binding protein n=1 Tax=Exiguobacterium oxidotolerans TaxID=223958 RepID=A0A653I8E5_9BACL|nr:ABC transporter ATP-binding protein [Exiguobacterium oxidotolerans]VWX35402.1 ABC transporter ATP-binding protein [Exiguobacterium oxidotolerans]
MNIQVKETSKSFDQIEVIRHVDLTIMSGEICCLLGPSSSGKTTLIRLMIGAIAPSKGTIHIGETLMPDMKLLNDIGFMPQNNALYEDLTAEDNLKFFGSLYKLERQVLKQRIEEVLKIVELTAHRHKRVHAFSGGMKKRLSLAISILHKPKVLFLDEPTVGIDPILRREIWRQFHQIKQDGTTIVVSTHVMDEVVECDRAALIYNGALIEYDTVDKLLAKTETGRVEELFILAADQQKGGDPR